MLKITETELKIIKHKLNITVINISQFSASSQTKNLTFCEKTLLTFTKNQIRILIFAIKLMS